MLAATTCAHADCIVADPTPTPLNARTAPNGRIIATLHNGQAVTIIDHAKDEQLRSWVYVSDRRTNKPIGWVFQEYIVCKGDSTPSEDCLTNGRILTMRGTVVERIFMDYAQGRAFKHRYVALDFYRPRCTIAKYSESEPSARFEQFNDTSRYWIGRHVITTVKVSETRRTSHHPTPVVLTPLNIREEDQ
jgi:hypothetical protein